MMSSLGKSKRKRPIKYIAIEEKVVAFVYLLHNRTKPLPVTLSIAKEYAELVAQKLGETIFVHLQVGGKSQKEKWHW